MIDIAANIKRLRKLKNLSQKELATSIDIAQAQYSIIEGGKVVPTIPTIEKIAKVLEVDITELFKDPAKADDEINLSILEKVKLLDTLEKDEKDSLLKIIDMAIANKRLKDNLSHLIAS
jgi:transcriptional regulator with XRE-family HTH domain